MKKVVVGVEIDTSDAQGSIDALNEKLKELNQNAEENADAIGELEAEIKDLGSSGKKAGSDISDAFSNLPGPLGKVGGAFKALKSGVKALSLGFKGLAGAIAATGIGLLIVAVGSLTAYFSANEDNANKLEVAMAALESVFGNIKDAIAAVIDLDFKKALSSITTELVADAKAAAELTKQLQQVEIAQRSLNESRAKTNNLIEQAKLDSRDLSKSDAERAAALQRAIDLETEQSEKELANQRLKVEALAREAELAGTSSEQAKALSDERVKLLELESASLRKKQELQSQLNSFTQTIERETAAETKRIADEKAARDEAAAAEAERLAKEQADRELSIARELEDSKLALMEEGIAKEEAEVNLAFDRKLAKLEEDGLLTNEVEAVTEELRQIQLKEIRDRYKEEEDIAAEEAAAKKAELLNKEVADVKATEEQKKAARIQTIQSSLSAASQFTNAIQGLSDALFANEIANAEGNAEKQEEIRKKQFKANKALQIVNAIIGTASAIVASAQLGFPAAIPGIVAAAALGAVQIATIAAAKYQPQGGGGGSRPSAPAVPAALPSAGNTGPNVTFAGEANNLNQVGGGAENINQPVVIQNNVSVSETEITATQTNVTEYENSAELSG